MQTYDLIVIGSGPSGQRAAIQAAKHGKKVALIETRDPSLNCFTALTFERAQREAAAIDACRARGDRLPPLAGVPYAVKNLFDVQGLATRA